MTLASELALFLNTRPDLPATLENALQQWLRDYLQRTDVVERAAKAHWNDETGTLGDGWDDGWSERVLEEARQHMRAALATLASAEGGKDGGVTPSSVRRRYDTNTPPPARGRENDMRTDFDTLQDGDRVTLHPLADNPLHRKPVRATYAAGYFYCEGTNPTEGPDYYLGDVLRYNEGFTT